MDVLPRQPLLSSQQGNEELHLGGENKIKVTEKSAFLQSRWQLSLKGFLESFRLARDTDDIRNGSKMRVLSFL